MNRKRFFSLCAAAAAGAVLHPPAARAGTAARISERFDRLWSDYGGYRAGTPGFREDRDWAERSLLRAVAREMERLRAEVLREAGRREDER